MQLNENIKLLPEAGVSVTKRVEDFLRENPHIALLRLDQDLMNMPLPSKVTEEMKAAVDEVSAPFGVRLTSPWSGYESLKEKIVLHLSSFGADVTTGDVFITSGMESANSCLAQLFGKENNVLLTAPGDRHLAELCRCLNRSTAFARLTPENGFCPVPEEEEVDLIYLASPHPVTGVAMNRETLKKWVDYAREKESVIFYDASLSEYIRDENYPRSIYEIEGATECAIELFSFEKGYGVQELKIAYVIIPALLSREGTRLRDLFCARQPATATPPSFVMQKAAEMLFSPEAREETERILHRIKKVARTLSEGLTAAGIPNVGSESSPFIWAQCPAGMEAWSFFDALLEKKGIVVTPGSRFGYGGERFFRLTAFGMPEEAAEGVLRIAEAVKEIEEDAEKEAKETEASPTPEETAAMLFSE